jgi:hypothetical protein
LQLFDIAPSDANSTSRSSEGTVASSTSSGCFVGINIVFIIFSALNQALVIDNRDEMHEKWSRNAVDSRNGQRVHSFAEQRAICVKIDEIQGVGHGE